MVSRTNEQALEAAIEKALTGISLEEMKGDAQETPLEYQTPDQYHIGFANDFNAKYTLDETLSPKSFLFEHMMPKNWEKNWNGETLNDLQRYQRNQKLKTLGDLTLITTNLNSKLRNQAWDNKKATLQEFSSIRITTAFLDKEEWNLESIIERADMSAQKALIIWK